RAELLLLDQVAAALLIQLGEVLLALGVDRVAGGLEAGPQRVVLLAGRRADRLPARLQVLEHGRRAALVGDLVEHLGQRLGLLAQLLELGHGGEPLPAVGVAQLAEPGAQLVDRLAQLAAQLLLRRTAQPQRRLRTAQRALAAPDADAA